MNSPSLPASQPVDNSGGKRLFLATVNPMPLDIPAFNDAFGRAYDRVHRSAQPADLAAEQEKLRALVPADASEEDRTWTGHLINDLAEPPPPPREWSELYHEAVRIHSAVYPPKGTTEEQIAMLADGRRRIWEIADRATPDEEWDIRAMTEDLESMENWIRNPPFPLTETPFPSADA
jgi:hypothetical protein